MGDDTDGDINGSAFGEPSVELSDVHRFLDHMAETTDTLRGDSEAK
jgi:hypothetical protein